MKVRLLLPLLIGAGAIALFVAFRYFFVEPSGQVVSPEQVREIRHQEDLHRRLAQSPIEKLLVYQGTPKWEGRDKDEAGYANGSLVERHGLAFLPGERTLPPPVARQVGKQLVDHLEIRRKDMFKACIFHADYGLEFRFTDGSSPIWMAVCLSCGEVEVRADGKYYVEDFDPSALRSPLTRLLEQN